MLVPEVFTSNSFHTMSITSNILKNNHLQQQGYGPKGNKMHYSGPLLRPSGNVDQMLKEHDRQIQEVFRRSRINKTKTRKVQGDGNQFVVKPCDFIPMPLYPSTRGSSIPVFTSSRGNE